MELPQSVKQLRHLARGLTVIPFPKSQKGILGNKTTLWKTVKRPSWLAKCSSHWLTSQKLSCRRVRLERIFKTCIQHGPELAKGFAQVKKETEIEMLALFSFLEEVDVPAKMNLIDKFNQKIQSGEIRSIDQIKAFLEKTKALAECIQSHLRMNEYNENFTKEISFDAFEQGFNPQTQEALRKANPNYFSPGNP